MRCDLWLLLLFVTAHLGWVCSEEEEEEQHSGEEAIVHEEGEREGPYAGGVHDFHGFHGGGPHEHQGDHIAPEFMGPAHSLIEEVRTKIKMMFPAADYDHNERLTEEELTNWNDKQIRKFVDMNTRSMMRMIDANEDGKVTWHEFMRGMYGDKETRTKSKEIQQAIYKDRRRFDIADRDQDNQLNFEELSLMIHPEEHPEMNDVFVEEMMDGLDTDGDGTVSLAEYTGDRKEKDPTKKKMEDQFKTRFDVNGDGVLNKEEMREVVFPGKKDLAELEAYHVFRSLDKDEKGYVTLHDLLKHHEIIAGSKGMHYFSILERQPLPDDYSRKEEL